MFFVIKKWQVFMWAGLIALIIIALAFSVSGRDKSADLCRKYVSSLGYSPESKPYEIADITVPEGFGTVYEVYNRLQTDAGYDLTAFRGLTLTRYTFKLKDSENLYANILIHENKICGGDICNPALDGFMLPLKEKEDAS